MSRLPQITDRKFIQIIRRKGFIFQRQARGSHEIWFNQGLKLFVTIPRHAGKTIKKGTLLSMMKDAGLKREDLS